MGFILGLLVTGTCGMSASLRSPLWRRPFPHTARRCLPLPSVPLRQITTFPTFRPPLEAQSLTLPFLRTTPCACPSPSWVPIKRHSVSQPNATKEGEKPLVETHGPLPSTPPILEEMSVGSLLLINPLTSALAAFNLFLYTGVYTPLKQKQPVNTWVGAIVGAIPPMIGWAACTGGAELGSWLIGALLAFWQMPHFMALSYALKDDYHRGGFRMLINTHPDKVPGVVLRYSLAMVPIGAIAALSDMTTWWFALDSLIPTGYLTYLALQFKQEQDKQLARKIFRFSLLMLPVMMGLMLLHKKNNNTLPDAATLSRAQRNLLGLSSGQTSVDKQ